MRYFSDASRNLSTPDASSPRPRLSLPQLLSATPCFCFSIQYPSLPLPSASSRHNAHAALRFSQLCQRLSVPNNAIAYLFIVHQCRCFSILHNAFAIPGPSFLCHRSRWSMHCPRRTNHIESTPSLNYAVPSRIAALLFTAMPMQSRSTLFQRQSWHLHACALLFGTPPVPSYAFPMQYTASPSQNNASLFLCDSNHIGSYLRHR